MTQTIENRTDRITRTDSGRETLDFSVDEALELVRLSEEPLTAEGLRYAAHHDIPVYSLAVGLVVPVECVSATPSGDYILALSEYYGAVGVLRGNLRVGPALARQLQERTSPEFELASF